MENKGIYHQMMEKSKIITSSKFNLNDLQNILDFEFVQKRDAVNKRNKEFKEDIIHLNKRAQELNKEIPSELLAYTIKGGLVGGWFFAKYAEWL